ncbi:MAG: lipopolysaccharide biosynthesis protein [Acidimicrobiales bacterium]
MLAALRKLGPDASSAIVQQTLNLVGRQGLIVILALAANIIAARTLLPAGRGALALGLQLAFLASFVILLGSEKALPVVVPGARLDRTLAMIWGLARLRASLVLALGAAATIIGLRPEGSGQTLVYGLPLALLAVGSAMNRALEAASVNAGRSQYTLAESLGSGCFILLFIIGLTIRGVTNPAWWLAAYGVSVLLVAGSLNVGLGRLSVAAVASARMDPTAGLVRRTGYRLFPASIASFAALRSDRLILPLLDSTESLGLYVVVATLTDVATTPIEALSAVLVPRWRSRFLAGSLRVRSTFLAVIGYLVVAGVVAVVVGGAILGPVFGSVYEPARDLLPVLAIGSSMFALGRLAASYRSAQGFVSLVSFADASGMIAALTSYLVLIPQFGARGAAIGSIIGYGASLLILTFGVRWATADAEVELDEPSPPTAAG